MKNETASIVIKNTYSAGNIKATIVSIIDELHVIKVISDADSREYEINWWGIPVKNPNFIARNVYLEQLQKYFFNLTRNIASPSMATCYGLGGAGKTQVATEFIYQNIKNYKNIFWFCAEDEKTLIASYLRLAKVLGIAYESENKSIEMLKGWIKAHPRCLLVFVKARQYSDIENFLPNSEVDVLITSRYSEWPQGNCISIKITNFTLNQCREYIKKILGNRPIDTEEQISALANKVDYIPSAFAQACAFIHKNKITISRYLSLYEERAIAMLADDILPVGYHGEPTFSLWNATLRKIEEESPLAIRLLYLCSYLYHTDISYFLLDVLAEMETNNPRQELVEEARGLLYRYSFIEINIEQKTISLSPFVQEVIGFRLLLEDINYCEIILKVLSHYLQLNSIENTITQKNLLKHLEACYRRVEVQIRSTESVAEREKIIEKYLLPILQLLNDYSHELSDKEPISNETRNYESVQRTVSTDAKGLLKQELTDAPKVLNLAVALFRGDGTASNPSHLDFNTWYHPDICHYLLHMMHNQAQCIRVVFPDAGYGNNTTTFKAQLQNLIVLSNRLNKPALFISKEPGADNHFICGLVRNDNFFLMNPLGVTAHSECYQTLAELQQTTIIGNIWFSSTRLQQSEYEEGLVSCGAIALEWALHVVSDWHLEQAYTFWNRLKTDEPIVHDASQLSYYSLPLKEVLLPGTLTQLLNPLDKTHYQKAVCKIRQNHGNLLAKLSSARAQEARMPQNSYLTRCKDECPAQVVFMALLTRDKHLNNIEELEEYELLEKALKHPEGKILSETDQHSAGMQGHFTDATSQSLIHLKEQSRNYSTSQVEHQFTPQILMAGNHAGRDINAFIINRVGKLSVIKSESDIAAEKKTYLTSFWNIPQRNPHFTGREGLLKLLAERLHSTISGKVKPVVITSCHGLGGVGKTQLVIEYIYRHFEAYEMVCFIPARNRSEIESAFVELARDLNIVQKDAQLDEIIHAVKTWFLNHPNSLLVFDNAPNYSTIEDFLPQTGNYILTTSRYTEWLDQGIEVDVFSLEEAREYAQKILGKRKIDSDELLGKLATTVGCLPLALAQAVAYIRQNNLDIASYLLLYEKRKAYLLSKDLLPPGEHHSAVYVTWDITMATIQEESNLAPQLLTLSSYLASEGIPKSILENFANKENNNPQNEIFDNALGILSSYSMVTVDVITNTISMHLMLQTILLARQTVEVTKQWLQVIADIYVAKNTSQSSDLSTLRVEDSTSNLPLHIAKLLTLAEQLDFITVSIIRLSLIRDNFLLGGDYQSAEHELSLASKMTDETERWRYQAIAYEKLGAYLLLSDNKQSQKFLMEALRLSQQLYGDTITNELIAAHCALGVVCYIQNDIEQAISYFESALQMIRQICETTLVLPEYISLCTKGLIESYKIIGNQEKYVASWQSAAEMLNRMSSYMNELLPEGCNILDEKFLRTNKYASALQNIEIEFNNRGELYRKYFSRIMDQLIELEYPRNQSPIKMILPRDGNVEKTLSSSFKHNKAGAVSLFNMLVNLVEPQISVLNKSGEIESANLVNTFINMLKNFGKFFQTINFSIDGIDNIDLDAVNNFIQMMPELMQALIKMEGTRKKQGVPQPTEELSVVLEKFYSHVFEKIRRQCDITGSLVKGRETNPEDEIEFRNKSILGDFDKKIIKRFEEAGKTILDLTPILKEKLKEIIEFSDQLKRENTDFSRIEEGINKGIEYPIRQLFLGMPSVDMMLLWILSSKECHPEVFAKERNESQEGYEDLQHLISFIRKERETLINEILNRIEQQVFLKNSGKLDEESNLIFSIQMGIYILLLRSIDKATVALERIEQNIRVINYVIANISNLSRIEFEDFCDSQGVDKKPESLTIDEGVVTHYGIAVKKMFEASDVLIKYLDEKNQRSRFNRIAIPENSEMITILKELRSTFEKFGSVENAELMLQIFKMQIQYRKSSPLISAFVHMLPDFNAYLERIITQFSVLRRRMVLQALSPALDLMAQNAHQKELYYYQQANLVLQSVQLFDAIIFHYEEIKKYFNITFYIITEFPSADLLHDYLKQFETLPKAKTLFLHEHFNKTEVKLTQLYDKRGALSPQEEVRLHRAQQIREKLIQLSEQAYVARQNHDVAKLIECHEAMIELYSDNHQAYHNLGFYYHIQAEQAAAKADFQEITRLLQKAETMYRKSLKIFPYLSNVASYANFLCLQNRYNEAMPYLMMMNQLKEDGESEKLQCDVWGQCAIDTTLQKVVEERGSITFESSIFAYYLMVKCAIKLGEIEKMEAILSNFIAEVAQADDYISYFLLAQSCYLFNPEMAIPYDAKAEEKLGHLLFKENKFELALSHYERSINSVDCYGFTADFTLYANLAHMYHHLRGDYQRAEKYFQKALSFNQNISLCCGYALLLLNQRRWDEAIAVLMPVIFSDDASNLSYGTLEKQHLDEHLQQEIDRNIDKKFNIKYKVMTYYWLIQCYYQLGIEVELENTMSALLAWVEENPEPLYYRIIGYLYTNMGKEEEAEIYLGLALSLENSDTTIIKNNNSEEQQKLPEVSNPGRIEMALNRFILFRCPEADIAIQKQIMHYYHWNMTRMHSNETLENNNENIYCPGKN